MTTINPYLTFNGTCEQAFLFYQSVFGGEFNYVCRFNEMPPDSDCPVSVADAEKIMHISLPISAETILLGSDSGEAFGQSTVVVGNNFTVSINTESEEEATRLFDGLSAGGTITMPMNKTFWGSYFGMFCDQFGINWMVSHELAEDQASEAQNA